MRRSKTCSASAASCFSAAIDGKVYASHGTTIETRLTVFDKNPADDASRFDGLHPIVSSSSELLALVQRALSGTPFGAGLGSAEHPDCLTRSRGREPGSDPRARPC